MITAHDLFAGAGGSSTGLHAVPGISVVTAANHWKLAIEVHNRNHPDTDHLCADISQIDPRYFSNADLLWASPECTNHSVAKGRKRDLGPDLFGETLPDEAAERSRATMWDVPRFTEAHRYRAVIVENVVDAANWVPFKAWLLAMDSLGYEHQVVYLNSMHAQHGGLPAPQSRDRMYVVFWQKGARRPDLERMQRPQAWCPSCEQLVASVQTWKRIDRPWGRYRAQYYYRCPHHPCRGQQVEPGWLPAASAIDWSLPGTRIGDRPRPLAEKTRKRIAAGIARYWRPAATENAGNTPPSRVLLVPVEGRDGKQARNAAEAMRTMTTRNETGIAMPFIAELRGGGSDARAIDHPMSTVTASGNHHGLVVPYYSSSATARDTADPFGTLTTRDRYALITRHNSSRGDGAEMTTPAAEPFRTLTTKGHQSVLTPGALEAAATRVDDCLFRMLEPSEVAAGMAFPESYQWEGTRRERVRLAGNAVTPPAARDLALAVSEALTGEEAAPYPD